MGNRIIAVWGNPSSGKTVAALKLALELEQMGKSVVIVAGDLFCPALSAILPSVDIKNRTLGALLAKPRIKPIDVMQAALPVPKHDNIAIMGYKNGDNIYTYSKFLIERVENMLKELKEIAEYVIIDCSSVLTEESLGAIALLKADITLRLCGADLKAYSYFASHLSLIAKAKFRADEHVKILSNVKPGQEEHTFMSAYANIAYVLPHVAAIERQFYSASLLDGLSGKESKKYNAVIKKIVKDWIINE